VLFEHRGHILVEAKMIGVVGVTSGEPKQFQ